MEVSEQALLEIITMGSDMADRIDRAIILIAEYGDIDGAHHKQWLIDQVLRALLTDEEYEAISTGTNWDQGIAP